MLSQTVPLKTRFKWFKTTQHRKTERSGVNSQDSPVTCLDLKKNWLCDDPEEAISAHFEGAEYFIAGTIFWQIEELTRNSRNQSLWKDNRDDTQWGVLFFLNKTLEWLQGQPDWMIIIKNKKREKNQSSVLKLLRYTKNRPFYASAHWDRRHTVLWLSVGALH